MGSIRLERIGTARSLRPAFSRPRREVADLDRGGDQAVWAPNGREIFYRNDNKMMAVAVGTKPTFDVSKPEILFEEPFDGATGWFGYPMYDVTPDGQRFLVLQREEQSAPARIHIVLDWAEELKARVATNN